MKRYLISLTLMLTFIWGFSVSAESTVVFSGEKRLNNLVSELLNVSSISDAGNSFSFTRSNDGWIFISAASPITSDKQERFSLQRLHAR